MWGNQKKKKTRAYHTHNSNTRFMFLMALRQNGITAIHTVPKRKNMQLIILLRDLRIQ